MGHHHGHGSHAGGRHRWRLALTLALVGGFFVVELVVALRTGSLALLSDAGHMAGDVVVLTAALLATSLASRPDATGRRSFGSYRLEVLASGLAVLVMVAVGVLVVVEAIGRLGVSEAPPAGPVLVVGLLGLLVNLVGLVLLRGGAGESLNVRGAYLEVMADALGSVGVMISAVLVLLTGSPLADIGVALAIALFVLVRAGLLGREVLRVLSQHTPQGIDPDRVRSALRQVPGVVEVHDLHLWTLTSGMDVASVHLVTGPGADGHAVLDAASATLATQFGLDHATIQVDPHDHAGCHQLSW